MHKFLLKCWYLLALSITTMSCRAKYSLKQISLLWPSDRDLGQHWLRYWLAAWWHQAITWINVDFSLVRFCGIHMNAITTGTQDIILHSEVSFKISLKFVPKGPINNIAALVQIMACRRPGDKPLSEPMMVSLPMHICVTRPQWVNQTPRNKFQWNLNLNFLIFIQENAFENVICQNGSHFVQGGWVKFPNHNLHGREYQKAYHSNQRYNHVYIINYKKVT